MGPAEVRADFTGALSAIVVIALIVATTAVMLVTLNTKAGAVADLAPVLMAGHHADARISTGAVVAVARPADRR
jgi:hypothetical protein